MSNNVKWSWTILRCMRNLIIKMILKRKQVMMHNFILRKFYFPIGKYNHFYRTLSYYSFCIESLKCMFTCGKMIRAKRRSLISFSPYKNMSFMSWMHWIAKSSHAYAFRCDPMPFDATAIFLMTTLHLEEDGCTVPGIPKNEIGWNCISECMQQRSVELIHLTVVLQTLNLHITKLNCRLSLT